MVVGMIVLMVVAVAVAADRNRVVTPTLVAIVGISSKWDNTTPPRRFPDWVVPRLDDFPP